MTFQTVSSVKFSKLRGKTYSADQKRISKPLFACRVAGWYGDCVHVVIGEDDRTR